jgi:hypothetical protein
VNKVKNFHRPNNYFFAKARKYLPDSDRRCEEKDEYVEDYFRSNDDVVCVEHDKSFEKEFYKYKSEEEEKPYY